MTSLKMPDFFFKSPLYLEYVGVASAEVGKDVSHQFLGPSIQF